MKYHRIFLCVLLGVSFLGLGHLTYKTFFFYDVRFNQTLTQALLTPWKDRKRPRVCIIPARNLLGESAHSVRLLEALDHLERESYIFALRHRLEKPEECDRVTAFLFEVFLRLMRPDFILTLQPTALPECASHLPCYTYVTVKDQTLSLTRYFDGALCATSSTHFFSNTSWRHTNPLIILDAYPAHPATAFKELTYKQIFFGGSNWDPLRSSTRYQQLYKKLDDAREVLTIYGPHSVWQGYKGYKGLTASESFFFKIQEAGIGLCLHSQGHLDDAIPTSRIFEFVAAGAIVISDKHPWILKHFGDSVLYIDHTANSSAMAAHVLKHYDWIQKNPEKATQMARKAHEIFTKKFASEIALEKLIKQHIAHQQDRSAPAS